MEKYRIISQVGEGTFGRVYKCEARANGRIVALKKIPLGCGEGISFSTIREIRCLQKLISPRIVDFLDVFIERDVMGLVLEYMPYDLTGLISSNYRFSDEQIYSIAFQLLDALCYIHASGFIHRDIKPSNVLLNGRGRVKLADFGLTREPSSFMTNRTCTLWYRAPELLLGDAGYCEKVDVWSVGCVLLELRNGAPIFKGEDELSQAKAIFSVLGAPQSEHPWNELLEVENYYKQGAWPEKIYNAFGTLFQDDMLALFTEIMRLEPLARLSAKSAMLFPAVQAGRNVLIPLGVSEIHELDTDVKHKKQ